MELILNNFLLIGSIVLLASIFLSKSSTRFGLPILVLFMFVGIVAGSEGLGGIPFENYELTHSLSLIALCLIIFSGGMETKINEIKPLMARGVLLSTLGVLITTGLVGVFAHLTLKMSILESLLLGAILSATDAAAVFSLFKDKQSQVCGPTKTILKFESGSNDPMAYFLVSILIGFIESSSEIDFTNISAILILNPLLGLLFGWITSKIYVLVNNKINLEHLGLYPALNLAFLFLTYAGTSSVGGNGFLAVYIFGISIGNKKLVHGNILNSFYDGLAWLSQIGLFVMLGLLVFPSRLMQISLPAIALAGFLMLVARPLAIFLCLVKSKFNIKDKVFISWAGLKGASPIVFASFAATHVGESVHKIFDIVFFVVLLSALIQGSTLKWLSRKLSLLIEAVEDPEYPIDFELLEKMKNGIFEQQILSGDYAVNNKIIDLSLPRGAWVLFIKRSGTFIIPDGSTELYENDKALVVTKHKNDIEDAKQAFVKKKIILSEEELAEDTITA